MPAVATAAHTVDPVPLRRAAVREVLRSGTDPEQARALFEDVYDARDLSFAPDDDTGAPFGFRYRSTGDDHVSLRTSSVSAHRTGVLAPDRQYLMAWSVEGGVVLDPDRDEAVTLSPGVPVVCPAGRPFTAQAGPGTIHLVHFDADFLEAVAVVGLGAAPVPLAFPAEVPPVRLRGLQGLLRGVAGQLLDVSVVDGDRAALDLQLAEAVLDAFGPAADGRLPDVPVAALERAKAYVYAHFARPLAASEIAAAAGTSVRTLQETFQRHEGTTPMAFLRDLRLEKARLALQLADVRETSVSAVAHSCGFRHMGRFAGSYVARYGEHPGDTLRGRRRLVVIGGGRGRLTGRV